MVRAANMVLTNMHHTSARSVLLSLSFLAVGCCASPLLAQQVAIENLIVVPIDRIAVPARAPGVLASLTVREGDSVETGQLLAQLDDAQARIESDRANTQLQIAKQTAESAVDVELAQKTLERTEQISREQEVAREISHRKAANEIRVLAAQKAEAVAGNELKRAAQARKAFVDSVSQSEIDGLELAFQRSKLETQQAAFERELDKLQAESEDASAVEQQLAIAQSRLGVSKAASDQSVTRLKAKLATHEATLAELIVGRHQVKAPFNGVVIQLHRRTGQWVEMGEPVIELLRLDRLRAEGFVPQEVATKLSQLPTVQITVEGDEPVETRSGVVVFVNPEVDPVNGDVRVWIEFDNADRKILPGMKLSAVVDP